MTPDTSAPLIDRVAREMTAGEVPAGFRARVEARLAPHPASPLARTIVTVAAAAAAILTAAVWLRPAPSRIETGSTPQLLIASNPGPESAAARVNSGADARPTGHASRRPAVTALSADELAWLARAVPPLPATPVLSIAPIQPAPLSIAPISVDTLATDPLEVVPLDGRSGARRP